MAANVLLVDDDPGIGETLGDILEENGFSVKIATSGKDAIALSRKNKYGITLVDMKLPDISGAEVVKKIAEISPGTDYIYITTYASVDSAIEAVRQEHVVSYETKPLDVDRLLSTIKLISERKGAEEALKAKMAEIESLNQELMKLNRVKSEFLTRVSHELRTPIVPIKGYAKYLLDKRFGEISSSQQKAIAIIRNESVLLENMIGSILDIARLQTGRGLTLSKEELDPKQAIAEVLEAMRPEFEERKIDLVEDLADGLPRVLVDRSRFIRVIANLVGNALKFTPGGGRVSVRAVKENKNVKIEVTDNGVGIAADKLEKIFDKFYQEINPESEAAGGIGMGLTIAREIIEAHGGKIWAESKGLGKGSTFGFTLPFKT